MAVPYVIDAAKYAYKQYNDAIDVPRWHIAVLYQASHQEVPA